MGIFKKQRVYLDFAAGAEGNPSSPHEEGKKARERLEAARASVAKELQVKADDVIFTSGATEANAIAIIGHARARILAGAKPDELEFLYLPSAHASIAETMRTLKAEWLDASPLPISNGRVDIVELKKMLTPKTALVAMEAVCGETGTIWNTREVATELKRARGARAYLHVDASQAAMTENMTRAHFDTDLMTLDGGKLGVPGVGVLVAHRTIPLAPLYGGGGQERGLRSGTENVEAIEKFAAALRAAAAPAKLIADISPIPGLIVNAGAEGVPHILNISLPGRDTDYLVALLDHAGFAVSTRSACETAGSVSRAVLALTGDAERARATLRISWGPQTRSADLVRFAPALAASVDFLDASKRAIL
jgi:cysteine desulfurase